MALKLGHETGSTTNYLLSGTRGAPTPVVGMGATMLAWTDRHAATIVKVTGCQIHVRRDRAVRIDRNGLSECQSYEYFPDPRSAIVIFRKTKRGWRAKSGFGLRVGERDEYYDFGF